MDYSFSQACADELDQTDQLSSFRDQFYIPRVNDTEVHYFTGNSLGLQPKTLTATINSELEAWKLLGVEGHFKNSYPWVDYHRFGKKSMAEIVGARPDEVVAMNSLTVNLHLMLVTFYQPVGKKTKIIMEAGAFPSDQYAVESQLRFRGLDPETEIIELVPREGEHYLRTDDIIDTIKKSGDSLALVILGGVQYYSGQFFDIENITRAGHEVGAMVGFDMAHAAGNVLLQLHDHEVDFAVWCSYKYLNSGPGGVAGVFIHDRHGKGPLKDYPRFGGWWGHREEERFKMKKGFIPMPGADGWQISNVNILSSAAHIASLELFDKAGIDNLRNKSIKLTGYLEFLLKEIKNPFFEIITPSNPEERGCQLSLLFHKNGKEVYHDLTESGFVVDWREPDVIRVAPVPLYNTFNDVYLFANHLKKLMDNL